MKKVLVICYGCMRVCSTMNEWSYHRSHKLDINRHTWSDLGEYKTCMRSRDYNNEI